MIGERAKKIRMVILDVDGVLTDGRIVYDANGVESKFFNVKDGHGIKLLQRAGITVAIISGRESEVVTRRAAELGIERVYQRALDKVGPYLDILEKTGLSDSEIAYMGDDLPDVPLMRRVGLAVAPADALEYVLPHAHLITGKRGGWGAVRELCDLILREQGLWESICGRYFL
jgi:3-deoxy-D-manno-octulosonate 8-phosphate phosphatase (KDO 8-P phosphatase)